MPTLLHCWCRSFMPNHHTIMHSPMLEPGDLKSPENLYNPDRQLLDSLPSKVMACPQGCSFPD